MNPKLRILIIPAVILPLSFFFIKKSEIRNNPIYADNPQILEAGIISPGKPDACKLLVFQNMGQRSEEVLYYIRTGNYDVEFQSNKIRFHRFSPRGKGQGTDATSSFDITFMGSDPSGVSGNSASRTLAHVYSNDDPANWQENIPVWREVVYKDLYPGIDLKYEGNGDQLKATYYVHPGADPSMIRCRYEGISSLTVSPEGELVIQTADQQFVESAPVIYQTDGERRLPVEGSYRLTGDDSYTFSLGSYDSALELVIDPELVDTGSFGGSNYDAPQDMTIDNEGYLYITGYTWSDDFPVVNAAIGEFPGGPMFLPQDAFVTKIDPSSGSIIYSTYLGGASDSEWPTGIVVDHDGNAYITGYTSSDDFPVMNAYQAASGGFEDIFLTKLNSSGQIEFSTYLGGANGERAHDIALLDPLKRVVLTGEGQSVPLVDPIHTPDGSIDGFISIFSNDGDSLLFSTTYGGGNTDRLTAMRSSSDGKLYFIGETFSGDFPTADPFDNSLDGASDVVILKFDASDHSVPFATYFGGSDFEEGKDIGTDTDGSIYFAGRTGSFDLPLLNATQSDTGGSVDGFLARFKYDSGTGLYDQDFGTYIGGSGSETAHSLDIRELDLRIDLSLGGTTFSDDFPEVDPVFSGASGIPTPFGFLQVYHFPRSPEELVSINFSSVIATVRGIIAIRERVNRILYAGTTKETEETAYGGVAFEKRAQLEIRKIADIDTTLVGDLVEFLIEVENVSDTTAHDVVLTDLLDNECFTFLDALGDHTHETGPNQDIITFELGDIPPAGQGDNTRQVSVAVNMKAAGDCLNLAGASAENADPVSADASVHAVASSLDLTIDGVDIPKPEVGEEFTITYTITNTGTEREPAARVVSNFYPRNMMPTDVGGAVSFESEARSITMQVEPLDPGESTEVFITYRLRSISGLYADEGGNRYYYHYADAHGSYEENVDQEQRLIEFYGPYIDQSFFRVGGSSFKSGPATGKNLPAEFEIYMDSVLLGTLSEADSGALKSDLLLTDIEPLIHLVSQGDPLEMAVFEEAVSFYSGNPEDETFDLSDSYQLLIPDFVNDPVVLLKRNWRDSSEIAGMVDVYMANTCEGGEDYTVVVAGFGTLLAENLAYTGVSEYVSLDPVVHNLEIRNPSGTLLTTATVDLTNYADQALTFIITPFGESAPGIRVVGLVDSSLQVQPVATVTFTDEIIPGEMISISHRYTQPFSIEVNLPKSMHIELSVYDMKGRKITDLASGAYLQGVHTLTTQDVRLSSGIYIYRFVAGDTVISRKFVLP